MRCACGSKRPATGCSFARLPHDRARISRHWAIRPSGTVGASGQEAAGAGAERVSHVMLPVQYLRQPGHCLAEPENPLVLAVLQTVLYDCRGAGREGPTGRVQVRNRQAYDRAMAYVASRDRTWPYRFENLCETIGVDAGSLPQRLARGRVSSG